MDMWERELTVHSSSSVHTLDPEVKIAFLSKNSSEAFVDTTSTFTVSYYKASFDEP